VTTVTTLPESVDTLVVGAGHAGLAMSAMLSGVGREHLVLERRDRLGGGWQDRWDGFRLVTPNWSASFPGWAYDGPDPDGFMARDQIVERVARYADAVSAPVALATAVERVTPANGRFRVRTSRGDLSARQVVVTTGSYHRPRVPGVGAAIADRVTQLHSHDYRTEAALPPGGVLVVGTGQTGVQIAEELHDAGRSVYLAVGRSWRAPRRYRGRDFFAWIAQLGMRGPELGLGMQTVDRLPDPDLKFAANPHLSGRNGGQETNLRRFAAHGIRLAGRLAAADGERLTFSADLADRLAFADAIFDRELREVIDTFIAKAGLEAPPDDRVPFAFEPEGVTELDLAAADVSTIIWATGYGLDYGWIDAPIFDGRGYPRNDRGATEVPGLFFLGLLWQHTQGSATLFGPNADGPHLLDRMAMTAA
jgi:putative flavoprotein involved in K+ transport